jgi:hypothetical protein
MSDTNPEQFSDEQARGILARAIEIDAHGPLTTIDQLRQIAEEIGVSPTALETALQEQRSGPRVPRHVSALPAARKIAALGVPLGLLAGSLIASGPMLAVMSVMGVGLVVSGLLAIYESGRASLRSFHLKNTILWGGALVGSVASAMLLSQGSERTALLVAGAWCVRSWISSGVLGSATILAVQRSRRREDDSTGAPTAPTGAKPARPGFLHRLLGAVEGWLRSSVATRATAG